MAVNTGHDCNKGKIMRLCERKTLLIKCLSRCPRNVLKMYHLLSSMSN